jgi:3-dehydroquinate synthase
VLRGIALVQLPTTLLAMVDAAVGGKTGINHPRGKNLLGAFHQPALVLADTATLATLPARELRAGWAEVIKHGVIRDAELFADLEQKAAERGWNQGNPAAGVWEGTDTATLTELVRRAVAVKVQIVNADEREQGERMFLNYGHTLGHALEAATGYDSLLHGEAVAMGMHAAMRIAVAMGQCAAELVARQQALIEAYGLRVTTPASVEPTHVINLTLRDKKVSGGKVRWILPTGIGAVTIRDDVPEEVVRSALA